MANPDHRSADDERDREGTPKGRRLGRVLIPLGILLVIAVIFTYMLVVAQGQTEVEEEGQGAASPGVVLEVPAPSPG
ncbi:hypothetical protein ACI79P_13615 [Blastococcus sp. SYSU DS0510]